MLRLRVPRSLRLLAFALAPLIPGSAIASPPSVASLSAAAAPPQLTIVFSRTELSAADDSSGGIRGEYGTCTRDDRGIAPLDTIVAPYIASHYPVIHPVVGSVETGHMPDQGYWCAHNGKTAAASWSDMLSLQTTDGWRFIAASRTRVRDWSVLTQAQITAETCGSRDDITNHALLGANGQYNFPDNKIDLTVQQQFVQQCFSFGREYGTGVTTLAWSQQNSGLQLTRGIHGGHCTDTTQPCSQGISAAYMTPSQVIRKIKALQPGQWLSLQSYVFVTDTNPTYSTNPTRWDCTSSDPTRHWTNDVERYCWVDFQAILAAIPATIQVNAPDTVATIWGMSPPG
jgi:hypothetical protein